MNESDLPESWRKALREQEAAKALAANAGAVKERAAKPPRPPIQPALRFFPWGALAMFAPVLGVGAAFAVSFALHLVWPNPFACVLAFGIFGALQAVIAGRAIDPEKSSGGLLWRGFIVGAAAVPILMIPVMAELSGVFLLTFLGIRLVSRLGWVCLLFVMVAEVVALIFFGLVRLAFNKGLGDALDLETTLLTASLVMCYPLVNGAITAFFPVEEGLIGRFDALFAGLTSALPGQFVALVIYRTTCFVLLFLPLILPQYGDDVGRTIAVAAALACGNWVCVWRLFAVAYSSREETERTKTRTREPAMRRSVRVPAELVLTGSGDPEPAPQPVGVEERFDESDAT